ncbi:MAG: HEAT repeat domain-containing protein [Deltaproteobacteria bacterium]|nr:HEAT repeat domain-containing protein [Deltaproteobacteria bacterium]
MAPLLAAGRLDQAREFLAGLPLTKALGLVQSLVSSPEPALKWPAVDLVGELAAQAAAGDPDAGRGVACRLVWSLNEEAGAAALGAPEALGALLAAAPALAPEFVNLLISYVWPEGNFLEFPPLLAGAVWGLGRLAQVDPGLVRCRGAAPHLAELLSFPEPAVRGHAAWALGLVDPGAAREALAGLADDPGRLTLYRDGRLEQLTVGSLARQALAA